MFIVKWVEMDDIFSYYPCTVIVNSYDEAMEIKSQKEDLLDAQSEDDEIYVGKIISEIYIDEISL